jgi:hypothetical protein
VPLFLSQGGRIPRPAGSPPRFRFWVHTGRAEPNTRLGILSHFEVEKRRFALTSQLDLVALDRVQVVRPSEFHGLELTESERLPVAFVRTRTAVGTRQESGGTATERVPLAMRTLLRLSGQQKQQAGATLAETTDGLWVPLSSLSIVEPRKNVPSFVKHEDMKWVDIGIRSQVLTAYQGSRPVYVTLVSTGTGMLGDPETTHATPRGVFSIFAKHLTTKMSGDELGAEYLIDDVPYVQYFHKSYAIHGAFWHNDFGQVHSHGCVNVAPADAAWLFEFTSPELPAGWHGAYAATGTTVFIHE